MEERLNRREVLVLLALTGVLAYTTFQWGGGVRTGRYEYLLVLGLLAMMLSLGRSRDEGAFRLHLADWERAAKNNDRTAVFETLSDIRIGYRLQRDLPLVAV
jgi:hypothetical protein